MIKRIRDKIPFIKPQQVVSLEEWEEIRDKATFARKFFSETNYLYNLMSSELKTAEDSLLEGKIQEVREEFTVAEGLKRMFITTKKELEDDIIGRIKYIRGIFRELQSWIQYQEDLEKKEAAGVISIDRGKRNGKRT